MSETLWDSGPRLWDDGLGQWWDSASSEDIIHGGAAFLRPWRPDYTKQREERGITERQKQAAKLIESAASLKWQDDALRLAIDAFDAAEQEGEDEGIFFALIDIYQVNAALAIEWINTTRKRWLFLQNQNAIAVLLLT
jgi:hypothetical protein